MNADTVRNPAVVRARQHITDAMDALNRAMDDPALIGDPTLTATYSNLHVLRLRLGMIDSRKQEAVR